jgi:hypothetical protein
LIIKVILCLYVFLNSFGNPCPLYKYDILEKKNPSCLLHNKLYRKAIFIFSFYLLPYYLGIFDTNYIICKFFVNFKILFFKKEFSKNKIVWNNMQSFGRFKNILFLTWKFQNPLIIVQTCVEMFLHYINEKYWNNFENIKNQLNHLVNML